MSDGSTKNIEDVVIGDSVKSLSFTNYPPSIENKTVNGVLTKKVNEVVRYTFDDGSTVQCTLDHPLYENEHGWVSSMLLYGQKKDIS